MIGLPRSIERIRFYTHQNTAAWEQWKITEINKNYVPNSNNKVAFGVPYFIKSVGHGTVLDDWGGKTGENSAALQPDNAPDSVNRAWILIPNAQGFRIKSVGHGTVLDDWGGKTGENSAALQPDDVPDSVNRTWILIPNAQGFRIKSVGHGTVLDDWGGKTGENSAALQPDDVQDSVNRTWTFVRVDYVPNSNNKVAFGVPYRIKSFGHGTVLDDWGGKTGENSAALQPDDVPDSVNRTWILIPNAQGFRIKSIGHGTVLDDWGGKTGENSAALQPDDVPDSVNRTWILIPNAQGFRIKSVGHGTVLDDWGGKTGENSAALQPDDVPDSVNRTWTFVRVDNYKTSKLKLKSWKGDYLHRPDSPQGVTTWNTGIGNEWTLESINGNKVKLKSWKGDYLHRPDSPQGVTTWNTGIGNEWTIESIDGNKVKLKSWKGDYLHRPDSPQGVTSWNTGIGNEWTVEPTDIITPPEVPTAPSILSPGFIIKNETIWPLQISLNQVGPLYYDVIQPGQYFVRHTGAVWFTIKASIFLDEKDRITVWDAILPVGLIVGTVIFAAVTAGAAAYAGGPALAAAGAAGAAGVTGLSSASALATATAASTLVGAGFSAGAALVIGGAVVGGAGTALSATATAALKDIFKTENISASRAGSYAGPPWPFRESVSVWKVRGGPTYRQVSGMNQVEVIGSPLRIES